MKRYTLVAGVDGVGRTSLRGVLEGQGEPLGQIIDPDATLKAHGYDVIRAGRAAVAEIQRCLEGNISFTQETTLSGRQVERTLRQARSQGYDVALFYVGLDSLGESLTRIHNRVQKGGHDIPPEDVARRFAGRFQALERVLPYCDTVTFYDNENGFIRIARLQNGQLMLAAGELPRWFEQLRQELGL